jgi:hypothetical protein
MELEGSSPHPQVPVKSLYPEPAQSSPYPHPTLKIRLNIILHLRLDPPSGLFLSDFPNKILYTLLPSPIRTTFLTQLILLDLITRTNVGEDLC